MHFRVIMAHECYKMMKKYKNMNYEDIIRSYVQLKLLKLKQYMTIL